MTKDEAYWDRYHKYLGRLSVLNSLKRLKTITNLEYLEMKKSFLKKYRVQDYS